MFSARRLPGPNLYSTRPGAVLEVLIEPMQAAARLAAWRGCVAELLERLGWTGEEVVVREWPLGAGLFITAPLDGLLAATDVLEQAWACTELAPREAAPPCEAPGAHFNVDDAVSRLQVHVQHDRNRRLVALARAAALRDLAFSWDDDVVAVGSGTGVRVWPVHGIPDVEAVEWERAHDIPVALVTGSNGKTTTVRLAAAMLRAAGHVTGHTCTSGVYVGTELVEGGDWSGPAGARLILHDSRVSAAVLETARGGILRRGIATSRADAAVVTRVAADHFGEYGVFDIDALGDAKLVVARPLRAGAPLVLNADDPVLASLVARGHVAPDTRIVWFTLDATHAMVRTHLAQGGGACVLDEGGTITLCDGATRTPVLRAADTPITLGGAARYNIANVLAATALAHALGAPLASMREALRTFGESVHDNPGRLHVLPWRGATVVVDFVHNPDGWRALHAAVHHLRTGRLVVTLGQAGDRDDDAIREIATAVAAGAPDVVVLKEMPRHLRGREPGEAVHLLEDALTGLGIPPSAIRFAEGDVEAARVALAEARPGDLVILATHATYGEVMALVRDSSAPAGPSPS